MQSHWSIIYALVGSLLVFTTVFAKDVVTDNSSNSEISTELTTDQVSTLIAELNDNRFATREAAQQKLAEAGPIAIAPLQQAAMAGSPEQASRAIVILHTFALHGASTLRDQASLALEGLAETKGSPVFSQATLLVEQLRRTQQPRILAEISKQGGTFTMGNAGFGAPAEIQVTLDHRWKGSDDDLTALKRLPDLKSLQLHGAKLTDRAVPHLSELTSLRNLQIYGTQISDAGTLTLQEALLSTQIERRTGAVLGVGGYAGPGFDMAGCLITSVLEDSAAAKAGIQAQDIITSLGGEEIKNFEELQRRVSSCKPGEEIEVILLRDGQQLTKKVSLGEWK